MEHGVALGPWDLGTLGPWLLAILNCLGQDTVELLARQQVTTIDHLDISNMLTGNMPAIMGMLMHVHGSNGKICLVNMVYGHPIPALSGNPIYI